jgi:hypothetical protein
LIELDSVVAEFSALAALAKSTLTIASPVISFLEICMSFVLNWFVLTKIHRQKRYLISSHVAWTVPTL